MQNAFVPQKQRWSCPLGSSLSPTFDSVPGVAGLPRDGNGHVESQNGAVAGRGGQTGSSLSPPDQASVVWGGGRCTGAWCPLPLTRPPGDKILNPDQRCAPQHPVAGRGARHACTPAPPSLRPLPSAPVCGLRSHRQQTGHSGVLAFPVPCATPALSLSSCRSEQAL